MMELDPAEVLYLVELALFVLDVWLLWSLEYVVLWLDEQCVHTIGNTDANTSITVIMVTLETNAEVV